MLEAAAKQFGWGKEKPTATRGFGLACGTEKGSYVATCAEVAIDEAKRQVRVVRAATAFECGAILNPDHLKNQIEGAVMMGLGGALFEEIDFADGKILNPSFSDYRLPRFRDTPVLETVLLDRKDLPSAGAGETPIIAIAPAVGQRDLRGHGDPSAVDADGSGRAAGKGEVSVGAVSAIVPACGQSTRMGRPKLALPLGDATVIARVVAALRAGGVETVLVVIGPRVPELVPLARSAGAEVLALVEQTPDMRTTVERGLDWIEDSSPPFPGRPVVPRPGRSSRVRGVGREQLARGEA